jgi:hypothetical protein
LRPDPVDPPERPALQQDSAHVIGLQALAWLAADPDRIAGFMAASGANAGDLRAQAADPDFLGAVLDHLMTDDTMVIAFCDAHQLPYTAVQAARAGLPGGASWHWT